MAKPTDLVQGTLDLLILKTLALQPMHGWGIAQRIRQVSREVLQVNQGALYPALHRLEQQGWIRAKWGESENNRQPSSIHSRQTVLSICARSERSGSDFL
jgi:transcriptional regulator